MNSTFKESKTTDLLVAGAGIAGLHVATQYLTSKGASTHPTHKLLLVERNTYLGGRIYTHHQTIYRTKYQWEAGAGRIPTSHHRIINLIKDYGLTFQHWTAPPNLQDAPARMAGPTSAITSPTDPFPDLIPVFLKPLLALLPNILAEHTLSELLHQIHGSKANDFIKLFPYWAEFHTLRADVALQAFMEGPLGQSRPSAGGRSTAGAEKAQWGGCAEGLGELPKRMGEDIQSRGGEIRLGTSVLAISPLGEANKDIHLRPGASAGRGQGFQVLLETNGKKYHVHAKKVVLALDVSSLRHVKGPTQRLPVLKYLKQEPLLRTYAVFPTHKGKSWFSGMAKQVVPGPIRFFIPMSAEKGLAMISYTEGKDAMRWMGIKSVKEREKAMMKALRELYPDKEIPDPLMIKFHGWETGCTYWLPARGASATAKEHWIPSKTHDRYNVEEESDKSVEPIKGLYLCSESFAVQQSWMESALVQAEKVLAKLLRP